MSYYYFMYIILIKLIMKAKFALILSICNEIVFLSRI